VKLYRERLEARTSKDFFAKTLDELFNDMPFDESRPPFATLAAKNRRVVPTQVEPDVPSG